MVMLFLKPEGEPFPSVKITLTCSRALAVSFQILRHPGIPAAAVDVTCIMVKFFGLHLGAQGARFDGLAGILSAKAGGLVTPYAVRSNKLNEPERRSLLFIDRSHGAVSAVNLKPNSVIIKHYLMICATINHCARNSGSIPLCTTIFCRTGKCET